MKRRSQGASAGDTTDEQSIDAVAPNTDLLIINKEGDGRLTAIAEAKLREKYEERRRWLDGIKGKKGCAICGEKNPLTLRLRVRPRQRVPFSPESKNLSRSKKAWETLMQHCTVICLNCLLKEEPHHKSGRPRKVREMVREVAEIPR
jgi:hypothetical protein